MSASNDALRRSGLLSVLGCLLLCGGSCDSMRLPLDASGSKSTCSARVYCLGGLLDVFSRGLTEVAETLQSDGIDAVSMGGGNWPQLADSLVKTYANVENPGPLVLIGHSFGADSAVHVAEALNANHIPVKLIIALDGASPAPIPPNVERCVNLYTSSNGEAQDPARLWGRVVTLQAGNDVTHLENIEATADRFGAEAAGLTHGNIDSNPAIQRFVMDQVLPLCTGSGPEHEAIPAARVNDTAAR